MNAKNSKSVSKSNRKPVASKSKSQTQKGNAVMNTKSVKQVKSETLTDVATLLKDIATYVSENKKLATQITRNRAALKALKAKGSYKSLTAKQRSTWDRIVEELDALGTEKFDNNFHIKDLRGELKAAKAEAKTNSKAEREQAKQERINARNAAKAQRLAAKQQRIDNIKAKKQWNKVKQVSVPTAAINKLIKQVNSVLAKPLNPTETRLAKKFLVKWATYPTKSLPRRARKLQVQLNLAQALVGEVKSIKNWK